MPAPIDWSAIDLCVDADLREHESDLQSWIAKEGSGAKWRLLAKNLIGERLDLQLKDVEIATDVDDVKDLIGNPGVLKTSAVYLTLHLLANDLSIAAGDLYDRKAVMYWEKYNEELPKAFLMISLDTDESGTIEDSEKYAGAQYTGVRLRHGG